MTPFGALAKVVDRFESGHLFRHRDIDQLIQRDSFLLGQQPGWLVVLLRGNLWRQRVRHGD